MIKTIQGHFQEGRFVPQQPVQIPDYVEVVIVVTDHPVENERQALHVTMDDAVAPPRNPRILREPDPSKSVMLGRLKDTVVIPDDFDEPLEEMMEYMY